MLEGRGVTRPYLSTAMWFGDSSSMGISIWAQILQYLVTGVSIGCIYGMVAIGFNIIYNSTGIINFAQGEFVMLGGMVMITLTTGTGIPVFIAFFLTTLIVALIGACLKGSPLIP